jgi:ATP-dependent Clp protease ATP-binding subunit ClpC
MWQRFTKQARTVVFHAQEEVGRLGDNFVSSEHLLLGILSEPENIACHILDRLSVSPRRIREELVQEIPRGNGQLGPERRLTAQGKRTIDLAYDEARLQGNNYIGSEHLLLGLIREPDTLAGRVLGSAGVTIEAARQQLRNLQDTQPETTVGASPELLRNFGEAILALDPTLRTASLETLRKALFGDAQETTAGHD